MSRIVVYDLNNRPADEFTRMVDVTWTINGNPFSSGGGYNTVELPISFASKSALQFGRMVTIHHAGGTLPIWAGVIDPPWYGAGPVKMTLYNAEYLMSMRTPDNPFTMSASLATILAECIRQINAQEELYIRLGDTTGLPATQVDITFDQRDFWQQIKKMLQDNGAEMVVRPVIDTSDDNRLYIYLDVKQNVGVTTNYLLHDGLNANMKIQQSDSVLDAVTKNALIVNRVIGISGASTSASRKQTAPQIDAASITKYRLRSSVQKFGNTETDSTLLANTQAYLSYNAYPILKLRAQIYDTANAYSNCAPGNLFLVNAGNMWLPGAVHGWAGAMRLITMEYQEANGFLLADLFGAL